MRLRELWLLIGTAIRVDPWGCVASLPGPFSSLAYPLLGFWLKYITDAIADADTPRCIAGLAGLLATIGGRWAIDYASTGIQATVTERVGFAFDDEILRLTAESPGLEHHERVDYQDRLELLRRSQGVLGASLNSLIHAASSFVAAAGTLTVLAMVHPLLLGLVVFVLPAVPIATLKQRWLADAEITSAAPSRLGRHLRTLMFDRNAGMELRIFRSEQEVRERYRAATAAAQSPVLQAQRRGAIVGALQDAVFTLAFVTAVGFVLWRASRGHGTAGDVVLAVVVCRQVQQTVLWPISSVAGLGTALRAASRLLWLRDYAAAARSAGERPLPDRSTAGIVFEHVWFRYPGAIDWTLRDFSARVPSGSIVALVGDNGAGKTTLVKLLCRFYVPTSGRIRLDGVDLAELDPDTLRAAMSAAFQDFVRFELTAQRAVGVGELARLDDTVAVQAAVARAGNRRLLAELPNGAESQLGARWSDGVELSGGQWQQIALARALLRTDPRLLFLDEPTASLDAQTEHSLFERFAAAARTRSRAVTVLVSHRFSTVRSADLILVLDHGRLVESGTHGELMARGGHYAELYSIQATAYR